MEVAAEKSRSVTVLDLQAFLMPFLPFVYGYPSSCPRAQCTPNKSVPTLRYTRRHGPIYTGPCPKALTECSTLDFRRSSIVASTIPLHVQVTEVVKMWSRDRLCVTLVWSYLDARVCLKCIYWSLRNRSFWVVGKCLSVTCCPALNFNNNNNVHLSRAHRRLERSHGTD